MLLFNRKVEVLSRIGLVIVLLVAVALRLFHAAELFHFDHQVVRRNSVRTPSSSSVIRPTNPERLRIKVFSTESDRPNARKQRKDIAVLNGAIEHVIMNTSQQRTYLKSELTKCGKAAISRFENLLNIHQDHLATLIWKYCGLYVNGGVLLDSSSLLVVPLDMMIHEAAAKNLSVGVLNDQEYFSNSMHGSFLFLPQPNSNVSKGMLQVLIDSSIQLLQTDPHLLPQALFHLVQKELANETIRPGRSAQSTWIFLEQKCSVNPFRFSSTQRSLSYESARVNYVCPGESGYCCQVYDREIPAVVAMGPHFLLPYQKLPDVDQLVKPYNQTGSYDLKDLPYMSTVRETIFQKRDSIPSNQSSIYDILSEQSCLPSINCIHCLRTVFKVDACKICRKECTCYCETICQVAIPSKLVSKEVAIKAPTYRHDPSRLIPRIIHQTWYEEIDEEKYYHTVRFVESFRQSGWEYRFYTDDMAATFLSTHFPPEVRQAYDALLPGAFKADLFRYCVLLIHGGLYADVDILLVSNLDAAIDPDVGFIAPIDSWPGSPEKRRMCLWNGFMAAAPGHPFLAKVIELVVNNARNRFTSVEYDNMFCPSPEFSILHAHDALFTAGPCILGVAVNKALGRPGQARIDEGELRPPIHANVTIPGRTVIMSTSKEDLGAQHFTLWDKNMIVAGTDFPDSNDRKHPVLKHYSSVHNKPGVYGADLLYADKQRANEEIRFVVRNT